MATNSNKRTQTDEESVNEGYPQQAYEEPPPPYLVVVGLSSIPNQNISDQSSVGNHAAPMSNQPPPTFYDGYAHSQPAPSQPKQCFTYLQPATEQPTLKRSTSALPTSQPIHLITTTNWVANSDQPLFVGLRGTPPSQPMRTQLLPRIPYRFRVFLVTIAISILLIVVALVNIRES